MENSDQEKIAALERRGFKIHLTRHAGGGSHVRHYCRVRSAHFDQSFYGETMSAALSKAIETLQKDNNTLPQ